MSIAVRRRRNGASSLTRPTQRQGDLSPLVVELGSFLRATLTGRCFPKLDTDDELDDADTDEQMLLDE